MEKMPRQYFRDYLKAEGDREKEREALQGCPEEWKDLVRTYIKIHKGRQNERDAKQGDKGAHGKRV